MKEIITHHIIQTLDVETFKCFNPENRGSHSQEWLLSATRSIFVKVNCLIFSLSIDFYVYVIFKILTGVSIIYFSKILASKVLVGSYYFSFGAREIKTSRGKHLLRNWTFT